jgi:hypothetical protein
VGLLDFRGRSQQRAQLVLHRVPHTLLLPHFLNYAERLVVVGLFTLVLLAHEAVVGLGLVLWAILVLAEVYSFISAA